MLGERANSREDEAITVQPAGVLGVELHELVEKNVGNRCHAPVCEILSAAMLSIVLCAAVRAFLAPATGRRRYGEQEGQERTWAHRGDRSLHERLHRPR